MTDKIFFGSRRAGMNTIRYLIKDLGTCESALKVIAEFPITDPHNQDAINLKQVAIVALEHLYEDRKSRQGATDA